MSIFIIKNLTKTFKSDNNSFNALNDINLDLSNCGLVSITGKSGSGKSTFLNILAGIERPTKGKVLFLKKDISKMSDRQFSNYHINNISIIFQHYNLFNDLTSLENTILPLLIGGTSKKEATKKVKTLFEKFELTYLINQKVKFLSGGEKQRVAIIRSLVTNPIAILCDEPTGALDYKNGVLIMNILKEISKEKLVLMVSHNKEHVEKYSDRIITFKDGRINSDIEIEKNESKQISSKKYKYSSSWNKMFFKLNLKRDFKKLILSIISCSIGFSAIFAAVGFSTGSNASQKNALTNNLSMTYSTASKTTYYKIDNSPLSYEKGVRPTAELVDEKLIGFNNIVLETNLSNVFTPYPIGRYLGKEINGFEMIPLYDISLSNFGKEMIIHGEVPDINNLKEVIVNEEFARLLSLKSEDAVDELFRINNSSTISYKTGDINNPIIKDTYSYDFNLRIAAVVKEFSFLNTPKIYYSYKAAKTELKRSIAENISAYLHQNVNFYDLIENAENDDAITGYSSILFITDVSEKDDYFDLIGKLAEEKDEFQISSNAYQIQQSYITFTSSFSSALYVFVIIAFIGSNLILGMISLSTFIENKKESAIMTCLGARTKSIISIYLSENYIVMIFSLIFSVLISIFLESTLNDLIYRNFALKNLIVIPWSNFLGIEFGLVICIFLIGTICSSIFTLVPLLIYRKISLVNELRDE